MTQTNTQAVVKAHKPRTWYGVSASEFQRLVATETNPQTLAEMRAYAADTAKRRAAKSPRFAAKWERIAQGITAPATAPKQPKAAKARKSPKASADPIEALLASTGMTAQELVLALAQRIA